MASDSKTNKQTLCVWMYLEILAIRMQLHSPQSSKREAALPDTGGARGVVVIVVGNGHGDTSSNPGRD